MCRMARVGWKLGLLVVAAALSVVVGPSDARLLLGEFMEDSVGCDYPIPLRARLCSADRMDCVVLTTTCRLCACTAAPDRTVRAVMPVEQLIPVTLQCRAPSAPVHPRAGPAPYLQCGGSGGECKTPGGVCRDVAWPDFRCPGDFTCARINAFYW